MHFARELEQGLHEFVDVVWATIGKPSLEVRPHPFIGIDLWCVGGKGLDMQARVSGEDLLHFFALVDRATVEEHDHRSSEVTEQVAKEDGNLNLGNVLVVEVDVEAEVPMARTYRYSRDRRDLVSLVAVPEEGRLALGRPRSSDVGKQKEAGFVKEDKVRLEPCRFFLSPPTCTASISLSRHRRARLPCARASGRTNPCQSTGAPHGRGGNAH